MASEESCQSPSLCANGCGFFGSPATLGLCSQCYKDFCLSKSKMAIATLSSSLKSKHDEISSATEISSTKDFQESEAAKHRCGQCKKKVGLTNRFKCRCGSTYCAAHRYPEDHECSFDFKAAGRSLLAKANPLIKADKLDKI